MKTLAIVAVFLCGTGLADARQPRVAQGDRVRLTAPQAGARSLTGQVLEVVDEALVVQADRTLARLEVPLDAIERLEVRRGGHHPRLRYTLLGAGIGAGAGALMGVMAEPGFFSRKDTAAIGATLGAGIGAVSGLIAGSTTTVERWERVDAERVKLTFGPAPRGLGLQASIAF